MNILAPTNPGPAADGRPSWQDHPCPAWCASGPHDEREFPVDRHHMTDTVEVGLSVAAPVVWSGGVTAQDVASVSGRRHAHTGEEVITVEHGRGWLDLSPAEARLVAAALLVQADRLDARTGVPRQRLAGGEAL